MKKLKTTILSVFIALCCLTNGNAQENKLKASDGKKGHKKVVLSLGGGTSMPSSDGKDKAFLSNSTAINADLFLPLIRKGWDGGGARDHIKGRKMDFGLNVGGTYNFGGSGGFGTTPNPFAVTGQTSSMVSDKGTDPRNPGFRMGVGPQANFYFGKFIVSPMVLGEYFSMTQKERSFVQTTQYNGQSYEFILASMPKTKTSGFAVTPKLRLHYMFNDRFGLFADASYTTGPKVETTVSKLIPNGNPSPQSNSYNIQQLQTGTMVKGETKSTAYSAMGFNFGVVIGLGKNNHDTTKNSVSNVRRTAGGTPIDDTPTAQKNKTKSNSANERTAGDIKKGWDGTVKGLFVGINTDILVAKNGGVEKFIEQINKGGKGKANLVKYGEVEYIKVVSKEGDFINSDFYPIENFNNVSKTIGGGSGSGAGRCRSGGCDGCHPEGEFSTPLVYTHCICGDEGSNPMCDLLPGVSIGGYVQAIDHSALATPITTDNTGQLTATSVTDIEHLLLAQLPHATHIK